jgi:hypothetical protein
VGKIPRWDEMIEWYSTHLPDERKLGLRVVHGDYKLDNLIFHSTENRVIGILDWELCTLGSPVRLFPSLISRAISHALTQLADLGNMTMPWAIDWAEVGVPADAPMTTKGYKNATSGVPIALADIEREYSSRMGLPYPIRDMTFVRSWMLFRVSHALLCSLSCFSLLSSYTAICLADWTWADVGIFSLQSSRKESRRDTPGAKQARSAHKFTQNRFHTSGRWRRRCFKVRVHDSTHRRSCDFTFTDFVQTYPRSVVLFSWSACVERLFVGFIQPMPARSA